MSDTVIPVSNTPIFDRLARERGYDRLVNDNPIGNPFGHQVPAEGVLAAGAWMAKTVPVMEPETVTFTENIDPERAEDEHGSFHQYMDDVVVDFYMAHPGAENATITSIGELDGTFTINITAIIRKHNWIDAAVFEAAELKDMAHVPFEAERKFMTGVDVSTEVMEKKFGIRLKKNNEPPEVPSFGELISSFVTDATKEFREEHPTAVITAIKPHGNEDGTMGMTFEAIEPEIGRHEVKDLAGQQLELYRLLSMQQNNQVFNEDPEVTHRSIPKPLWITDEHDGD